MLFGSAVKKIFLLFVVLGLAACGGTFKTSYDQPAPAKDWRVVSVDVTVPDTLTTTEDESYVPKADILWHEDAPGDRRAQVDTIMTDAIRKGAAGAHGSRPVRLAVVMKRFHAMTFTAELKAPEGVHNVQFMITAYDARTGAVLAGPEEIDASFPALVGGQMARARAMGQTQKSQITDHVARTIAGWLGTGPDIRRTFSSLGA